MHSSIKRAAALAASILFLSTAAGGAGTEIGASIARLAVGDWPEYSRDLAGLMIQKYGPPDEIVPSQLSWSRRGEWTQIVVFKDALDFDRQKGLLEAVPYFVPLRRWRELAAFDRGVSYDPMKRELVVRTDDEGSNYLALNLADEVVRGLRTPADANAFYDKTVSLSASGKSSAYTRGLRFRPQPEP
ncbi:MAG: hypothetical protein ACHQ49_03560 [Elusimicrobiota bacterium]